MHMRRSGFTLVELLVVVAIIGAISGLAITYLGSAESESAETANIANIKRLTSAASNFHTLHKRSLPDKFDSLIRSDFADHAAADVTVPGGGPGSSDRELIYVPANVDKVIYCGVDTDDDYETDTGADLKGLSDHNSTGFGNSLAFIQLAQVDVDNLKEAGITTVYDISPDSDAFHGNPSRQERTLAAGDWVAIVNPMAARNGQSVYQDFGVDLSDETKYPRAGGGGPSSMDLSEAGVVAALQTKMFFVFGIGPNTTWIGDQKSGLQEAPECQIMSDGYYNRYFLVVAMPAGPNDTKPPYPAGVLDSTGKTARGAASWATRTE